MNGKRLAAALFTFLIFSTGAGFAGAAAGLKGCSSSCGHQSIRHPFYLRGDPGSCGAPGYELICEGNTTILELYPGRYVVRGIWYENYTLRVVDEKLESGHCIVPSRLPSVNWACSEDLGCRMVSSKPNYWFLDGTTNWVCFISCSMNISNEGYYGIATQHYIPCLSANTSTSVYGFYGYSGGGCYVDDVPTNCSFISAVPSDQFAPFEVNGTNIFQLLQKGFPLVWGFKDNNRTIFIPSFQYCLRFASSDHYYTFWRKLTFWATILKWLLYPFRFGIDLIFCLHDDHRRLTYTVLVEIICLDTAILLFVIATLIRCIVAPLCIFMFLASEYWKMMMVPIDKIEKFLRNLQTLTPTRYVYTDIIAMTRHFKEKLGQGGFGSVYKGELPGGHLVAIKMLGESRCNGEDFISEVSTIGRIHHLNVVRLVGFCSDGTKRALVYEFMPNGSLDKYIFSSNATRRRFTQEKLNEIALGVARGIDYLHRGCDMRILHFDIKPHNILLDQNFSPKVSDFGLAKLYQKEYSLVSLSAARGTIGYIAPELVSRSFGVISYKSDVYSFGMLLMEMAGGRRNVDHMAENSSEVYYPSWIYDRLLQAGGPETSNTVTIDDMERKLCKVGLWCIQMRPADRPPMSRVIEMLESESDTLQMPPKPFFSASGPVTSLRQTRQSFMDSFPSDLSIISEDE